MWKTLWRYVMTASGFGPSASAGSDRSRAAARIVRFIGISCGTGGFYRFIRAALHSRPSSTARRAVMIRTILAVLALAPLAALAAPVAKPVTYSIDKVEFQSTLVYDDSIKTPRPGLVMAPNWFGANEASIEKAKTIAGKDYVILLADVFGKNVRPKNAD